MRKFILPLAMILATQLDGQQHFCYTTEAQNAWFETHPEKRAAYEQLQKQAAEVDKLMFQYGYQQPPNMVGKSASAGNYTIPVVFHILHTGGSENISDDQVRDALNILTRDFGKENSDTADVVSAFKNKIGNPKIVFALATKDPSGACTDGIVRHWDSNTNWENNFSNYKYSWPASRYLNIYVVKTIESGAAGYTYLPGSGIPQSADAIVILSHYVGSIGSGGKGTSRALTHEVGHWLNLPHTWGGTNQPGVSCGDDGVSDTPITKGFSSCNLNNAIKCNAGIVENMQNYMDYAYCQRMFTNGQAFRMQNALNSSIASRNNLSTQGNLALTGVLNPATGCAPKLDIAVAGNFTVCAGKSLSLESFTSNASPTSYNWSANNGAVVINDDAANTKVDFVFPGTTTIVCTVSNSFGTSVASVVVTVKGSGADISSGSSEDFEYSSANVPSNWSVINSASTGWLPTDNAASSGIVSMYVKGESLPGDAVTILETPSYDFQSNPGAQFSFKYAYKRASTTNMDRFIVQVSGDCGGTWTDIYSPSNSNLASGSGGVGSELFVPFEYEWKTYEDIVKHPLFYSFLSEPNVRFRFYFKSDVDGTGYGNRFYLDEVTFNTPVGVNELTRELGFNVYPNPSADAFNIDFTLSDAAAVDYKVLSVTGAVVLDAPTVNYQPGTHSIAINSNDQLRAGIYFVNFKVDGATMSRKIVVQ